MEKDYKILVAYDKKLGIGYEMAIPWHIPEDMKRFKALTAGQTVIMGSKTFKSIINRLGKPLPNRKNVVLSRTLKKLDYENCILCNNISEVLEQFNEAWVIGGYDIYREFMPYVKEIYATELDNEYTCDVFFPKINLDEWEIKSIENKDNYRYIIYSRK